MNLTFQYPQLAWLLISIALLVAYYIIKGQRLFGSMRFSSFQLFEGLLRTKGLWRRHLSFGLRMLTLILLILALMRPQEESAQQEVNAEGIDIMMVIDISGSMRAMDFKPNRLEAVKTVAQEFVKGRPSDRIGLSVFARESFLQCPLTTDLERLNEFIGKVEIVHEKFNSTSIGLALAGAINRLRDSEAKSKVIILLSDGRNNSGELDPITAAELARDEGIRVYTIGAGKHGMAPIPVQTVIGVRKQMVQVDVDEETLTKVAEMTGGQFFRATDEHNLAAIYAEISKMETTTYEVTEYVNRAEWFHVPLLLALLVMALETLFDKLVFRRFP